MWISQPALKITNEDYNRLKLNEIDFVIPYIKIQHVKLNTELIVIK
jgi:hypothetical protein